MFFLQYEAVPNANSPDALEHGGAFMNFWMDLPTLSEARVAALNMIHEQGWSARSLEEEFEVCRDECDEDALEYFDQALIDKTVCEMCIWPIDAPDANEAD